jgi:peptidyl-prolyl cis-trans isomerase B (cyclophilin B)
MHLRYLFPILLLFTCCWPSACSGDKHARAVIHTSMGDIRVRLFDDVPRYRDFFLELAESGAYDSLAVSRIERDFVIQSGFVGSVNPVSPPAPDTRHPMLRGALGGSGSLFFVVQGRPQTDQSLDKWEKLSGRKFSPEWRTLYKQKGGAPQLEGRHTVFGEVTEGLEIVDKIAALPRDAADRPLQAVSMWVEVVGQ